MRKIILFTTLALFLGSCAKDNTPQTPQTDHSSDLLTRSINDIFTVTDIGPYDMYNNKTLFHSIYSDSLGNLYCGDNDNFLRYYDATTGTWNQAYLDEYGNAVGQTYYTGSNIDAIAIDGNGNWTFIWDVEGVFKVTPNFNSTVDLTSFFPGRPFGGLCIAPNGNMFVCIDSLSNSYDYYTEKIYRLSPNGILTLIADVEFTASQRTFYSTNILAKASGANLYLFAGPLFYSKINTNTKEVTNYNPGVPIKAYAAAINKANLYGISGNRVLELRPNGNHVVVGLIPNSLDFASISTFCINDDATLFFVGNDDGLFKLTLP